MSELNRIFEQLTPARQDKVMNLARALLQEQEAELPTEPAADVTGILRRGRPKGDKLAQYETIKTVKNGAGKVYRYRVLVTPLANGKKKEKYLNRIS